MARPRTGRNGSPPLLLVAQTEVRAPDSTDPKARATRTDRFPGSRVTAHTRTFPGPEGSSGWLGETPPRRSRMRSPLTVAGTAADQGTSPPPAFPIKPEGSGTHSTHPPDWGGRSRRWSAATALPCRGFPGLSRNGPSAGGRRGPRLGRPGSALAEPSLRFRALTGGESLPGA